MPSAKQIAWRKKFARMSKAGKFKKVSNKAMSSAKLEKHQLYRKASANPDFKSGLSSYRKALVKLTKRMKSQGFTDEEIKRVMY